MDTGRAASQGPWAGGPPAPLPCPPAALADSPPAPLTLLLPGDTQRGSGPGLEWPEAGGTCSQGHTQTGTLLWSVCSGLLPGLAAGSPKASLTPWHPHPAVYPVKAQ